MFLILHNGHRLAFDICACNMLLNTLANSVGSAYDHNGALAQGGISAACAAAAAERAGLFRCAGTQVAGQRNGCWSIASPPSAPLKLLCPTSCTPPATTSPCSSSGRCRSCTRGGTGCC